HSGTAVLPGVRPGLVLKRPRGGATAAGADRSSCPRKVPGERRSAEYAGVPEGILLPGRSTDGQTERLPGLVSDRFAINLIGHSCSAVPPHSLGCISATDCEKVHEYPAKSSALYCRSRTGELRVPV